MLPTPIQQHRRPVCTLLARRPHAHWSPSARLHPVPGLKNTSWCGENPQERARLRLGGGGGEVQGGGGGGGALGGDGSTHDGAAERKMLH
jgi:hypothetical protein